MKWRCWILKLEKLPKLWLASFHSAILKFKQVLLDPDTMSMDRISEIRCHLQRKVLKDTVKTLKDKVVKNH